MKNCSLTIEELDCLKNPDLAERWQRLVQENAYSGFMQSLPWAAFKQASGQKVIHLGIRKESELIAGTLIYTVHDEKRPTILVSPYGPVIPWDDTEIASACLRLL